MKMQVRRRQIETLLRLQDEMNTQVHPQWIAQHFPWYRAAWTEAAELMEHWGWKWWKKQEPDLAQSHLELIDILHFCLSDEIQASPNSRAEVAIHMLAASICEPGKEPFLDQLEAFTEEVLCEHSVNAQIFFPLAYAAGMTFDDLYTGYIGKNVLNRFRQDNGYKDGTYSKTWDGEEDNVHLVRMVTVMDTASPDFPENLYRAMEDRYRELTDTKETA